ncbi:hypothetical protein FACS1894166_12810 [Bacilli bacterium]|nr:hypothetical protein FACS1894166_12810 [Bacilli bacterium]
MKAIIGASCAVVGAGAGIGLGYLIWYSEHKPGGGEPPAPITPTPSDVTIQQQNPTAIATLNTEGSFQFTAKDNLGGALTNAS